MLVTKVVFPIAVVSILLFTGVVSAAQVIKKEVKDEKEAKVGNGPFFMGAVRLEKGTITANFFGIRYVYFVKKAHYTLGFHGVVDAGGELSLFVQGTDDSTGPSHVLHGGDEINIILGNVMYEPYNFIDVSQKTLTNFEGLFIGASITIN